MQTNIRINHLPKNKFYLAIINLIRRSILKSSDRAARLPATTPMERMTDVAEMLSVNIDPANILKTLIAHSVGSTVKTDSKELEDIVEEFPVMERIRPVENSVLSDLYLMYEDPRDSQEMEEYVGMISDKLFRKLEFAATVIVPEIRMFYQEFVKNYKDVNVRTADGFFDIEIITKPQIFNSDFLKGLFDAHHQTSQPVNKLTVEDIKAIIGDDSEKSVLSYIVSGDGEFDVAFLQECLSGSGITEKEVFEIILESANFNSTGEASRDCRGGYSPTVEYFVKPLVRVLFFNNIYASKETHGMDVAGDALLSRNFWLTVLKGNLTQYDFSIKSNEVIHTPTSSEDVAVVLDIRDTESNSKKLVIIGEQLDKLSESQITVDTVRGCLVDRDVTSPHQCTIDLLVKNRGLYTNGWKYFVDGNVSKVKSDKVSNIKYELKQLVFNTTIDKSKVKEEYHHLLHPFSNDSDGVITKDIVNYIDEMDSNSSPLILDVCVDLIAKLKYREEVISEKLKNNYNEDNTDINLTEAVYRDITLVELVKFISDQIIFVEEEQ